MSTTAGGGVLEGLFQSAADSPSSASESSPVLNVDDGGPSPPKRPNTSSSSRRKPSSPSKVTVDKEGMFPVRVVVERVSEGRCPSCQPLSAASPSPDSTTGGGGSGLVVADSYAIVSGHTAFSQLVPTVLAALGLPQLAFGARGLVELKGWKPLDFAQVTADPDATVDSFLRDFASHLCLKILTKSGDSATSDCVADMKERLLRTALAKNPHVLASIKTQQLRDFVDSLLDGGLQAGCITSDHIDAFNEWLDTLAKSKTVQSAVNGSGSRGEGNYMAPRFNDKLEMPKLQRWFQENPNPTRQKLQQYMHLLNSSNFRRHNAKISYQQMCNWFSNQRAMVRQKETTSWESTLASLASAARMAAAANGPSAIAKVFGSDVRNLSLDFNDFMRGGGLGDPAADAASAGTKSSSESSPPPPPPPDVPMDLAPGRLEIKADDHESSPVSARFSPLQPDFQRSPNPHGLFSPPHSQGPSASPNVSRSRLMFDPLTELPLLERWFEENPHPSWIQIDAFTETLNNMAYRRTYPHVSTHNVKIWFKNRRAKCKRLMGHMDK